MMANAYLGISAYYHDSAAALVVDGDLIAAAQEERFTRCKHDAGFPGNAVEYVLRAGGIPSEKITAVAFYDKPYIKFERLLETYHACAPHGLLSFVKSMPVWIREKLFLKQTLRRELSATAGIGSHVGLLFPEHHVSHAASAFFPSPFETAAILTIDGVGEWATTTIGRGTGNAIEISRELRFPHSLGLLYSAFTYYCGFRVNNGEYKLMGLAPYADRTSSTVKRHINTICEELVDIRDDGSFLLNMDHFDFATGLRMVCDADWERLFGMPRRRMGDDVPREYADLACAVQTVIEDIVCRLARTAREITGENQLVLAGGVALNCVANGKLLREGIFDEVWIQPAAGDAGGAVGAALASHYIWNRQERSPISPDGMHNALLGPEFSDEEIEAVLQSHDIDFTRVEDDRMLCEEVASALADGYTVGWFQGRMEFGPRALGNRSILADARNTEMQRRLNLQIKHRESFRPFAPSVLQEDAGEFFDLAAPSPYMLLVAPVLDRRRAPPAEANLDSLIDQVAQVRSDIPAVTHVDGSARVQTVDSESNPLYRSLIEAFKRKTGYGLLVNTSFNVRGEPIVCTPEDALSCFQKTDLDLLAMGHYLIWRNRR